MRTIEKIFQDEVGTGYPLEDILNNLDEPEIREIIQVCQKEPLIEIKQRLELGLFKFKDYPSDFDTGSIQTMQGTIDFINKLTKEIDHADTTKTS